MARVNSRVASRARRKKVMKAAKGYYAARSRTYRVAKQAVTKAGQYAYRDRRQRKRQFRALWIVRINAGTREHGLSYSRFINGLLKSCFCQRGRAINRVSSPRWIDSEAMLPAAAEQLIRPRCIMNASTTRNSIILASSFNPVFPRNTLSDAADSETMIIAGSSCER